MDRKKLDIEEEILVQKIVERIKPAVPLSVALWSAGTIAEYLDRSASYVRQSIITLPNFPKQIRITGADGKMGRPLWRAKDVVAWAESFIDAS